MDKRIVVLLVTMLGIALQCAAQTTVKLPKVLKFVKVEDGVNLHKGPSTTSPRLVEYYDPNFDGGDSSGGVVNWESARSKKLKATPAHADVVPVIAETGEWYQVFYDNDIRWGPEAFRGKVYIAKQFCHDVRIAPLKINSNGQKYNYIKELAYEAKTNGNDYFIEFDDMGSHRLGQIVDGFCILFEMDERNMSEVYQAIDELNGKTHPTASDYLSLKRYYPKEPSVIYFGIENDDNWYVMPASFEENTEWNN